MAKVVANGGLTVELSAREVNLVRQALEFSVCNNAEWYSHDDSDAEALVRVLSGAES